MRSVAFVSLGCAKNLVDTEVMIAKLGAAGWRLEPKPGDAETVVINTCAFIDPGEGRVDARHPRARRAQAPRPAADRRGLPGAALRRAAAEPDSGDRRHRRNRRVRRHRRDCSPTSRPGGVRCGWTSSPSPSTTFCRDWSPRRAPPPISRSPKAATIRARSASSRRCAASFRSRSEESILAEARALADGGTKELILIAQDTSMWGRDRGVRRGGLAAAAGAAARGRRHRMDPPALPLSRDRRSRAGRRDRARCPRCASTWTCRCSTRIPTCCARCCAPATASAISRSSKSFAAKVPGITMRSTFIVGFSRRARRARGLSRAVDRAGRARSRRLLRVQHRGRHAGRRPWAISVSGARERRERLDSLARCAAARVGARPSEALRLDRARAGRGVAPRCANATRCGSGSARREHGSDAPRVKRRASMAASISPAIAGSAILPTSAWRA